MDSRLLVPKHLALASCFLHPERDIPEIEKEQSLGSASFHYYIPYFFLNLSILPPTSTSRTLAPV